VTPFSLPRDLIFAGEEVFFPQNETAANRTIHSDWVVEAVNRGKKVKIRHAILEGPLDLTYAKLDEEFSLLDCTVQRPASFIFTTFARTLNLWRTTFCKSVDFSGASFERDGVLREAHFVDAAKFLSLRVGGNFDAQSAIFDGKAMFTRAQMSGGCDFAGAQFGGELNFNSALLDGGISFHDGSSRPATVFAKTADFMHAKMRTSNFQFASFKGRALFTAAEMGRAIFRGTKFLSGSNPSFRGVQFLGEALFQGALFLDNTSFMACQFAGMAHFSREQRTHEHVCFVGANFAKVNFDYVIFDGSAQFEHAIFMSEASFRDTVFRVASFSVSGEVGAMIQFQGPVDLRGCTYERIQTEWTLLLSKLVGATDPRDYDRQPYLEIENSYRRSGKDRDADGIYLVRKGVERRHYSRKKEWGAWLRSWIYKLIANYGVRPYRLIVASVVLLLCGAFIFSLPNAVKLKKADPTAAARAGQSKPDNKSDESFRPFGLACRLSLKTFLPVELPILTDLEPSDGHLAGPMRFSDFAVLLRLAGWILGPLGVAALTGLLRSKPSPPHE
jgi:uncharacterized protein YjbI with pentapeptide repeats